MQHKAFLRIGMVGLAFGSILSELTYASPQAVASQVSLCKPPEHVLFNCALKGRKKLVSLCASEDFGKQSGYLQYRFGKQGSVELEYPASTENTQNKFSYASYIRYRVSKVNVSFRVSDFAYSVFDDYSDEAGENEHELGVEVSRRTGTKSQRMVCMKPATSHLGDLEPLLPCDAEQSLTGCKSD